MASSEDAGPSVVESDAARTAPSVAAHNSEPSSKPAPKSSEKRAANVSYVSSQAFVISQYDRMSLKSLKYSDAQIDNLIPERARVIIDQKIKCPGVRLPPSWLRVPSAASPAETARAPGPATTPAAKGASAMATASEEPAVTPQSGARGSCVFSESDDLQGFTLRAPGCCGLALHAERRIPKRFSLCPACSILRNSANKALSSEAKKPSKPSPFESHASVLEDAERTRERLADQSQQIRDLKSQLRRAQAKSIIESTGDELSPGNTLTSINQAFVDVEGMANDVFEKLEGGENSLARHIWSACVENAKTAQRTGSKHACRYPRCVIRFAVGLLSKVGKNTFEEIRNIFGLPSARHVQSFSSSSGRDADGVLDDSLSDLKAIADKLGLAAHQRRVFLAFDGCTLKDGVFWDASSKEIVGFATDVYLEVDIMAAARQFMQSASELESKPENIPLAKTYLVFYLSAVEANVNLKGPAARFCITKATAAFLIDVVPRVIARAYNYGFNVIGVVCDGAAENRSAMSSLAKIPVSNFIVSMEDKRIRVQRPGSTQLCSGRVTKVIRYNHVEVTFDMANDEGEVDKDNFDLGTVRHEWIDPDANYHKAPLPTNVDLSKKIAFRHPIDQKSFVFIWQDMGHVIKRVVNALERANPGNDHRLQLIRIVHGRQEPLCLRMIHDVWLALGGGDMSQIRFGKLTTAHFVRDCFSRMRVPPAVNIVSDSVSRMLTFAMATPEVRCPGKELCGSLAECCSRFDRVVDIMNSASEKNAPIVNSAHHRLLYEGMDFLEWFGSWRQGLIDASLDLTTHFFPTELEDDVNGMLLALVCTARHELHLFPGTSLCQRRGQQDIVEHHFAHVRASHGGGVSVMAHEARNATAKAAAVRTARGGNCEPDKTVDNSELPGEERRRAARREDKS